MPDPLCHVCQQPTADGVLDYTHWYCVPCHREMELAADRMAQERAMNARLPKPGRGSGGYA